MIPSFSFFVPGSPATQGSKRIVGKPGFNGRLVDSCKDLKPWRSDVKVIALDAMKKAGFRFCERGVPIALDVTFAFPRPAKHFRTVKGSLVLRSDAPRWHTSVKDVIKMARAVEDAMTKIVYDDDKQIASYRTLEKIYTNSGFGAYVKVTRLDVIQLEVQW